MNPIGLPRKRATFNTYSMAIYLDLCYINFTTHKNDIIIIVKIFVLSHKPQASGLVKFDNEIMTKLLYIVSSQVTETIFNGKAYLGVLEGLKYKVGRKNHFGASTVQQKW